MLLDSKKREQKMLAWAYSGLFVFVTAFLWVPSRDGIEGVYILAFFIPVLAVLPWRKPSVNVYGGVFTLMGLSYVSWSLISSLWGADSGFFVLQWVVLAIWLAGSAWALQGNVASLEKLWNWLIGIGALTALVNVAVFYSSHPLGDRLEGITIARAPTLVGQVYGVVVLLAILQSWRTNSFKCALLYFMAAIPALAVVGLSQSRGPVLALAFALVIGLFWLKPSRKILGVQFGAFLLLLVTLFMFMPIENAFVERGASFRDQIWVHVLQGMLADPSSFIWGIGISQTTDILTPLGEFHHAHNAWLDILYRTGIIGLGLALLHLWFLLFTAVKQSKSAMLVLWLIYGCVCLFVDSRSLFWELDAKWFMYWIPAGLLAAVLSAPSSQHPTSNN